MAGVEATSIAVYPRKVLQEGFASFAKRIFTHFTWPSLDAIIRGVLFPKSFASIIAPLDKRTLMIAELFLFAAQCKAV
jgi:hypothetical protein